MKNQKHLICTSLGSSLLLQSFQIGKGLSMKCLKQELTCKIIFSSLSSVDILFMTDEQFGKMCFFMQLRHVASISFFRNLCIYNYRKHIYLYC